MKVVLLAGGLGTRISEYTDTIPKPMVSVGGKPLLWHIMKTYEKYDFKDWQQFRMGAKHDIITPTEFTLVCDLHSKYYKHRFYKPCTCDPRTVNKWIKDLNIIWDNGTPED